MSVCLVTSWMQGAMPLPLNFSLSGKCSSVGKCVSKNTKSVAENSHFGKIWVEIEILSPHNLLCRKYAAVCRKIGPS